MNTITKAWLEAQIEQEMSRGTNPQAVRDLAALITVHKYLCRQEGRGEMALAPLPASHHKSAGSPAHHLDKVTAMEWVENMEDESGVRGGKFSWHDTQQMAMARGMHSDQEMIDFYAIVNAMYSDYSQVAKKFGVDKPDFYACLAKAFIEDKDAVEGKVLKYYEYITK